MSKQDLSYLSPEEQFDAVTPFEGLGRFNSWDHVIPHEHTYKTLNSRYERWQDLTERRNPLLLPVRLHIVRAWWLL